MSLELRPAHLAADVDVSACNTDSEAGGFLVLIDYLSGFNSENRTIALRAPVEQSGDDDWQLTEKACLNVPAAHTCVRFDFPDGLLIDHFPEPADPRIRLLIVASRRTASIWFAGEATPQRLSDQTHQLEDFIAFNGYRAMMPAEQACVLAGRCGPFRAFTRLSIAVSDGPTARYRRPGAYCHRAPGRGSRAGLRRSDG